MTQISTFRDILLQFDQSLVDRVMNLRNIPQNLTWHPEGNVLKHTITVTERAIRSGDINLIIAALFHDIGKDETLKFKEDGNPTAYGHEKVSAELLTNYAAQIVKLGADWDIVHFIVKNHMRVKYIDRMKPQKRKTFENDPYFEYVAAFRYIDRGGLDI